MAMKFLPHQGHAPVQYVPQNIKNLGDIQKYIFIVIYKLDRLENSKALETDLS